MPLDYSRLKRWTTPDIRQSYGERDTLFYALAIGAGIPAADGTLDLPYVFGPQPKVLPTLATVLASDPLWLRNPELDIDWRQVVHGEQFLTMHRPLPAAGEVIGRSRIDEIYDKGAGKGAVLNYSIDLFDAADNTHYTTVGLAAFIRGQGGFGGCTEPAPKPHPLPDRAPDLQLDLPTRPEQAALYRLTGDYNPMHIDPAAAREAGFAKPVLHGLCYYGVACRALLKLLCDDEPARVKKMNVRFLGVVYPGETLRTEVWRENDGRAAFRMRVVERDAIVLGNGYFEFSN